MEYVEYNEFDICFNSMKLKYVDYDESISKLNFLEPTDRVNVFINLETAFKFMSQIKDVEAKIINLKEFPIIIASNILNLAAHYKRFFANNGLNPKVYLYCTDFESSKFKEEKYNEFFRSFYITKFTSNPKYITMTEKLVHDVFPLVRTICEFIPNVYFITGKNIEGSLIPYIIAKDDTSRKNMIITDDIYETQYSFYNDFMVHCYKRGYKERILSVSRNDHIGKLFHLLTNNAHFNESLNTKTMYTSLLSTCGNKERSIEPLKNIREKTFIKLFKDALDKNIITEKTTNPELVAKMFPGEEVQELFINNYKTTDIEYQYKELTDSDIHSIKIQIINRLDNNSLRELNATTFYKYPLILEALTL